MTKIKIKNTYTSYYSCRRADIQTPNLLIDLQKLLQYMGVFFTRVFESDFEGLWFSMPFN